MTDIVTAITSDYDGSPGGSNQIYTAAGPVIFTFSGTLLNKKDNPSVQIISRSDTAPYVGTAHKTGFQRFKVNFAPNDQYYAVIQVEGNQVSLAGTPA